VGDVAGGDFSSVASAVSADASVVVGAGTSAAGQEAFRWTEAGGLVSIGDLSGGEVLATAAGVSADGGVIAGTGVDSGDVSRAFRWTQSGGFTVLGTFSCSLCDPHAFGFGISRDGQVVVGSGLRRTLFGDPYVEAARWAGGGTGISALGHLPGPGSASVAQGASSNGSVIVGESDTNDGIEAFVWTSSSGMQPLPGVPGALAGSSATAVSADGSVIVGFANASSSDTTHKQAVRWTGSGWGTLELLGTLPGGVSSRAFAVSGDGGIVVGTGKNAAGEDVAFLWTAALGMRELSQVLADDYGLDPGDWILGEARGVSDVNAAGEFTVVGAGTNPAGDLEGFVAVLSPTACNDGIDQDGDTLVDYPDDPGCRSLGDRSEGPDCSDGLDQDGDGQADHPQDPQCTGPDDVSETPDCGDGVDNDGDGQVDFPADAGCRDAAGLSEAPACQDGVDNDGDGQTDFPNDPQCVAADDQSEIPDCSDGLDNDGDGQVDFPADSDCAGNGDLAEDPQCDDRLDNDFDGRVDYPAAYPNCSSAADATEWPACSDGVDNDGDGDVDFPADAGCFIDTSTSEEPVLLSAGDLLVVSPEGRTLFRIDPATGAQTLVSQGAYLSSPEGVAVRDSGHVVVADPSGLLVVSPSSGAQRLLSTPPADAPGLQVAFDEGDDPVVLDSDGLTRVTWSNTQLGSETPILTIPVNGTQLLFFHGYSLAFEPGGQALVTGFGAGGDGIYRYDVDTGVASVVTPGFTGDVFYDLALESDGTIVAAADTIADGPGIFRVTPSGPGMGTVAPLSTGSAWTSPSAVAVAPSGAIYAADAGTCDTSGCTGSEVVVVDPVSGARTQVFSGGLIDGAMDLSVVDALLQCANGVDDNGNGWIDYPADHGCTSLDDPVENGQKGGRGCGLGGGLALPVLLPVLRRRLSRRPASRPR
jgi:uncharacterized membrane protein